MKKGVFLLTATLLLAGCEKPNEDKYDYKIVSDNIQNLPDDIESGGAKLLSTSPEFPYLFEGSFSGSKVVVTLGTPPESALIPVGKYASAMEASDDAKWTIANITAKTSSGDYGILSQTDRKENHPDNEGCTRIIYVFCTAPHILNVDIPSLFDIPFAGGNSPVIYGSSHEPDTWDVELKHGWNMIAETYTPAKDGVAKKFTYSNEIPKNLTWKWTAIEPSSGDFWERWKTGDN